ncbi:MAG: hypothetical protein IJ480_09140 [Clostridia bacterium]|nr:hypothetical protein [Clostridia bacterium]
METKRNIKYFTAPPINVIAIVGWVILIIGVVLASMFWSTRIPGIITAIVGLFVIVFASGGKSNDTDVEFQIAEKINNLQERSEKKYEVYEQHFLKMLKPINLRGYDFEAAEEPFYYIKGKDGKHRTNYFIGANLIFTNEKIFILGRRFSLTDDLIDTEIAGSYFYFDLAKAELEEKVYETKKGDRTIQVPFYVFKILKADGSEALRMCVDYGADTDKAVENITRAITVRQKELEKRAKEAAERKAAFRAKIEAEKAADAAAAAAEAEANA